MTNVCIDCGGELLPTGAIVYFPIFEEFAKILVCSGCKQTVYDFKLSEKQLARAKRLKEANK